MQYWEKGPGDNMLKSQKNIFWQALLVTIFIFGIGILIGILLEDLRVGKVAELYEESAIELLDVRLQNEIYSFGNFECNLAVEENIKFADKIYEESKILDKYKGASRLTEKIAIQHKRYDLLRAMLFLNSLKIRENCNVSYHDIIYFYKYDEKRLDAKAREDAFSNFLLDLKNKKGSEILLIPIAADWDSASMNLILNNYGVSKEEFPVILIDEEHKIKSIEDLDQIEQYLK